MGEEKMFENICEDDKRVDIASLDRYYPEFGIIRYRPQSQVTVQSMKLSSML